MVRLLAKALLVLTLGGASAVSVAVACIVTPIKSRSSASIAATVVAAGGQFTDSVYLDIHRSLGTWYFDSTCPQLLDCSFTLAYSGVLDERKLLREAVPEELVDHVLPWMDCPAPIDIPPPSGPRVFAAGWPHPCLWCEYVDENPGSRRLIPAGGIALEESTAVRTAISVTGKFPRTIPLRPLWRGLTLNSLLFAALWALPLAALSTRRALRARRHNLCRACGYSRVGLASHAPCPECGRIDERLCAPNREHLPPQADSDMPPR